MHHLKLQSKDLTLASVFSAITIVLGITPLGLIPLGFMNITTLHIPTICAGIVGGPVIGGFVGLIFGGFSLLRNITAPTPLSFIFYNPLVSVFPRVLLGIFSAYLYRGLPIKKEPIKIGVTTALSTLSHSFTVLSLAFVFSHQMIYEMLHVKAHLALGTIFITNAPFETLASVILVVVIAQAIFRIKKKR